MTATAEQQPGSPASQGSPVERLRARVGGALGGAVGRFRGTGDRRSRGAAELSVLAVTGSLVAGVFFGQGITRTAVDVADGVTWLADDPSGEIIQVNPATGDLQARRLVATPGHDLEVTAEHGGHLYIVDQTTGLLQSLDLSSVLVSGKRRVSAGGVVDTLGSDDGLFLVDTEESTIAAVDPVTLNPIGTIWVAPVGLADATIDEAGVLWALEDDGTLHPLRWSGEEQRFDDDEQSVELSGPGSVLVAHDRGVTVFGPDQGIVAQVGTAGERAADVPTLSGELFAPETSPSDLVPVAAPGRGLVVLLTEEGIVEVDMRPIDCAEPGRPEVFTGRVFVPCRGAGKVVQLGSDGLRADDDIPVEGTEDPELVLDGDNLVINTPGADQGVVVHSNGDVAPIVRQDDSIPLETPVPTSDPAEVPDPAVLGDLFDGLGVDGSGSGEDPSGGPLPDRPDGADQPEQPDRPSGGDGRPDRPDRPDRGDDGEPDLAPAPLPGIGDGNGDGGNGGGNGDGPGTGNEDGSGDGPGDGNEDGPGRPGPGPGVGGSCGADDASSRTARDGCTDNGPDGTGDDDGEAAGGDPLSAPTGVSAVTMSEGQVQISWTHSGFPTVDGFEIRSAGGESYGRWKPGARTAIVDVTPGVSTAFVVVALLDDTEEASSATVPVTTTARPGQPRVTGVASYAGNATEERFVVRVSWTEARANGSAVLAYDVAVQTPDGTQSRRVDASTRTLDLSWTCYRGTEGCTVGGDFTASVSALNGVGSGAAGPFSGTAPVQPPAPLPVAGRAVVDAGASPDTATADEQGNGSIRLRLRPQDDWAGFSGSCGYEVDGVVGAVACDARSVTVPIANGPIQEPQTGEVGHTIVFTAGNDGGVSRSASYTYTSTQPVIPTPAPPTEPVSPDDPPIATQPTCVPVGGRICPEPQ